MNVDPVARLAQTLLYEGYLLYPYRPTSVKNRHRWLFGTLYPRGFAEPQGEGDAWSAQTECVVRGRDGTGLAVRVRFLHLAEPTAIEREVALPRQTLGRLADAPETVAFTYDGGDTAAVRGSIRVSTRRIGEGLFTVAVHVQNLSPFEVRVTSSAALRDAAVPSALSSLHVILGVDGGEFVSAIDPPAAVRAAVAGCRNVGLWPVLVGRPGARDTMLAAPIILEDYPRVAAESPGDFFDATEIDEILTLRVLTLTEAEKDAVRAADPRAQALLARTEALGDLERRRLHGATRVPARGMKVRLAPRPGGEVFDLALAGRIATVATIEEDYEGRFFVTVTVDDDPGQDLGADGRPGHRFFFGLDEVEILS